MKGEKNTGGERARTVRCEEWKEWAEGSCYRRDRQKAGDDARTAVMSKDAGVTTSHSGSLVKVLDAAIAGSWQASLIIYVTGVLAR